MYAIKDTEFGSIKQPHGQPRPCYLSKEGKCFCITTKQNLFKKDGAEKILKDFNKKFPGDALQFTIVKEKAL